MRVQNRLDLVAFPSPSLPRRCNSSPPAATNRLATHRSTPRTPAACRGTHQSAAAGIKSGAEGHRAVAAVTTTRRRGSAGPMPRASAGPGGGPTTNSGRRRSSTGGRRAQTKAAPSLDLLHQRRRRRAAPATTQGHRARHRLRAHPPRPCPAHRWTSTWLLLRRFHRGATIGPKDYVTEEALPRILELIEESWR
jgi:hypothetical protein